MPVMPAPRVTIAAGTRASLEAAVAAVQGAELLSRYGMTGEGLVTLLLRGQAAGDVLLVAQTGAAPAASGPTLDTLETIGLAWGMARGGFGSAGYLRLLLVAQEAAGAGVGRALVSAFEARCGSPRGGFFTMTEARAGAEAFYAKLGYRAVGPLPSFVREGRTEVLLWKAP